MDGHTGIQDDSGETLVEVLAALVILGIAAVAILTGLHLTVKASDLHRREATSGAYVRSFAEAIQNFVDANGYQSCSAAAATYGGVVVPDLPGGYTPRVTDVRSWNGTAWGPCGNHGIQRLDLEVTSSGDTTHRATERLVVVLRKPCRAGDPPCA